MSIRPRIISIDKCFKVNFLSNQRLPLSDVISI
uniref:Uncharacterized protein n=1 Tax=Tetranychus urticae TaxID=32264 RepID=T1K0W1_TETUR